MTVSQTDDEGESPVTEDQDVNAADSSDAEAQVPTMADAVTAALKTTEETPEEATPASDEPDSETSEAEPTESDELSDEEKSHLSERTQVHIRKLVSKRKEAEGHIAEVRTELDAIKPKAERMDELTGYMQKHGISGDHLNNALSVTAMLNSGDYDSAIPVLENLLSQARNAAGDVLPDDLQREVDTGYITEARAKELHKARTQGQRAETAAKTERERAEQERSQRDIQTRIDTAVTTADQWAKAQETSDPDWNLKRDRVQEKLELELRRVGPAGYPRTAADSQALLEKAKTEVEKEIGRFKPRPKPIDPPPSGAGASPRSKTAPKSHLEAIEQALS